MPIQISPPIREILEKTGHNIAVSKRKLQLHKTIVLSTEEWILRSLERLEKSAALGCEAGRGHDQVRSATGEPASPADTG